MAVEPLTESIVAPDLAADAQPPDPAPEAPPAEPSRSRRSVLGAGLAGLAGLVLGSLGRPAPTDASAGTALLVTQTGAGTALRGSATAVNGIAGFFTSANGPGVSGVTANNTKYGVYGGNDAATYNGGAAVRAAGEQNHGLVATTASTSAIAVKATNSAVGTTAGQGPAVQGLASGGTAADLRPYAYFRAAGEFAGPNGVIGAASSDKTDGVGVIGVGNRTSAVGVLGQAMGSGGTGVLGQASSSTGVTCGVEGDTASPSGIGVYRLFGDSGAP